MPAGEVKIVGKNSTEVGVTGQNELKIQISSSSSKQSRLEMADNLSKSFNYYAGTQNLSSEVWTGTTSLGVIETMTITYNYQQNSVTGSLLTSISKS